MSLVDTKQMFKKALAGKYAIGAFNVNNMELVQGIVAACAEKKAPVILQISKGAREYANPLYLTKLIEAAVLEHPEVPIVMHLDHGPDFEPVQRRRSDTAHREQPLARRGSRRDPSARCGRTGHQGRRLGRHPEPRGGNGVAGQDFGADATGCGVYHLSFPGIGGECDHHGEL